MGRKPKVAPIDPPTPAPDTVAKVASIAGTSGDDVKALLEEIRTLKAELEIEKTARTKAEQEALEAAENQITNQMQQSHMVEVPTGRTRTIMVFDKFETVSYRDDGRPILREIRKEVEVPTYFYKIDLPPVGGEGLKVNGVPLYHDTVYEFDIHGLRCAKEQVFRCWKHDSDINGSDENAYRKPAPKQISMKTGQVTPVRG